ncbi:hypothetical protein SAMN02745116_02169 [Pilibacter termitis]|uniref:Uncharacterized protein n=1 Tax=Pilibacter termitis TaxID=263852 RepID=A0A1T4QET0_9ENTE|nr:hypothetical protein [Pilibacter termitis]SKA02242.1 hypothetical protein SAMN02745116_02169 [Pilibacter termitis]
MSDYQWEKAIGRVFRSKNAEYSGFTQILGLPYSYRVIAGKPVENALLEVVDFKENELFVKVVEEDLENDFKYID